MSPHFGVYISSGEPNTTYKRDIWYRSQPYYVWFYPGRVCFLEHFNKQSTLMFCHPCKIRIISDNFAHCLYICRFKAFLQVNHLIWGGYFFKAASKHWRYSYKAYSTWVPRNFSKISKKQVHTNQDSLFFFYLNIKHKSLYNHKNKSMQTSGRSPYKTRRRTFRFEFKCNFKNPFWCHFGYDVINLERY